MVDVNAPLLCVEQELAAFRAWAPSGLSLEAILFGRSASWLPEGVSLSRSAVSAGVIGSTAPSLSSALQLANARPPDALLVALASEPAPGWHEHLGSLPDFKAVTTFGAQPAAAVGQGVLGAPFHGQHLGLALRWLSCELHDRTWTCTCGAFRVLGRARACATCGSVALPRVVDVGGRELALTPSAHIYPHHLGRQLSFDAPPVEIEGVVADGPLTIEGIEATVRSGARRKSSGPVEAPLRSQPDRCAACAGPLVPPIKYEPPDPRRFCATCATSPLRCDFCDVPVGTVSSRWPDGRKACRECWTTAVNDVRVLESLADRASSWMLRTLNMNPGPCPVRFEHAAAIARLNGLPFSPQPGYTPRPIGFYVPPPAGGPLAFIEHGTPQGIAYGVVVH